MAFNTGSKYVAIAVGFLTYFLLTPFLKNTLGPRLLGLRTLAVQALQFVGLAANAIGVSYSRFATTHYARGEFERMNAYLSGGFLLSFLSAVIYVGGVVIATVFADALFDLPEDVLPVGRVVILVTGLATGFHILIGVWKSPTFITQRFYIDSIGNVIAVAGGAVAVYLAFTFGSPSMIVYVVIVCGFRLFAELLFVIPLCRRALPELRIRLRGALPRRQLLRMVNFGALSLLTGLGYHLYYSTDSIIIAHLDQLPIDDIFYYSIAQRWDPQVRMMILAFVGVLTPLMTSLAAVEERQRLRAVFVRATRYSMIIGILPCLLLGVYADAFLEHWLDAEAALRSAWVLRVIMTAMLFGIPALAAHEVLFAVGRIGTAAWTTLLGGVLNILLSVLFVTVFNLGLLGVALGSLTALAFKDWLIFPSLAVYRVGCDRLDYLLNAWGRPLLSALPCLALGCLLRTWWVPGGLLHVFVQFAVVSFAYACCAGLIACTPEDRTRLLRFMRSRGGRQ